MVKVLGGKTVGDSKYKGQDLSDKPKSVTSLLQPLIPKMANMTREQLAKEFTNIINSEGCSISTEKRRFYTNEIAKRKTLTNLQFFVADIVLKGSGEGVI
jgi:hypothetical protein